MKVPEPLESQTRAQGTQTSDTVEGPPRGVGTMAIVRWVLVALTAILATGSILSYAGVNIGGAKSASTGNVFYCPMHPSVVQDHPGACPICSMTLVPKPDAKMKATALGTNQPGGPSSVAESSAGVPGLAAVDLTPERIQLIGMRTATARRESLGGELRTVGVVATDERGLAQVNTRFAGWIQKLLVSQTGERVRRGQVLATIYSPDVLRAQQELLVARGWNLPPAGANDGKTVHDQVHDQVPDQNRFTATLDENAHRRLELLGISRQDIDEILRTRKPIEALPIRSPVDGFVVAKSAVAGLAVQPGTVLFDVADLSRVWVTAEIYELDISRIRVGQMARLELASFPGETIAGKVQFIYPLLDPASRTLRVRLEFKNRIDRNGPRLRPGMYGTVYLDLPATRGVMVPVEALVDTGESQYLFVTKAGGHFQPRLVKVGAHYKDLVEILSGVAAGETVVTTGNFLIDSESRLRAAIGGQTSSER